MIPEAVNEKRATQILGQTFWQIESDRFLLNALMKQSFADLSSELEIK